jgi:hypothetical protein
LDFFFCFGFTVQKSDKSFLMKKGSRFIVLFNWGWSLVSKMGIYKIAPGAFLRKSILEAISGAFKTEISANFFTEG